jgi:aminoglycoside phosphotransferase (APT) family kinase protein
LESLTKPVVIREQIDSLAIAHLGCVPTAVKELTDGWFNAAFLLSLADGHEYVLKVAPPPGVKLLRYEANILRAEVEAMKLVQGLVPVPTVVAQDFAGSTVGSPWFLMDRLRGMPYNHLRDTLSAEQQRGVEEQVGRIVRALGVAGTQGFGMFNGPFFATWREAFSHLMADLRLDAEEASVELPDGAWEAASPHLSSLDAVTEPRLVHWDLWEGNLFVDPTSLAVTGVIDFERALWGDPLIEMNFSMKRDGFLDGYGSDLVSGPGGESRRYLYDLYLMLVMVVESKYRGFSADHEAWPRGQLAALLERGG